MYIPNTVLGVIKILVPQVRGTPIIRTGALGIAIVQLDSIKLKSWVHTIIVKRDSCKLL